MPVSFSGYLRTHIKVPTGQRLPGKMRILIPAQAVVRVAVCVACPHFTVLSASVGTAMLILLLCSGSKGYKGSKGMYMIHMCACVWICER